MTDKLTAAQRLEIAGYAAPRIRGAKKIRRVFVTDKDGRPIRVIDSRELAKQVLKRAQIEFDTDDKNQRRACRCCGRLFVPNHAARVFCQKKCGFKHRRDADLKKTRAREGARRQARLQANPKQVRAQQRAARKREREQNIERVRARGRRQRKTERIKKPEEVRARGRKNCAAWRLRNLEKARTQTRERMRRIRAKRKAAK